MWIHEHKKWTDFKWDAGILAVKLAHKNISMATASRDLKWGLENKLLLSQGSHNQMKYSYIK